MDTAERLKIGKPVHDVSFDLSDTTFFNKRRVKNEL